MGKTVGMELTDLGTKKRRSLVSYFIFSVVAGGGFIKGLDSFYLMAGDFALCWDYFKRCWFIPSIFFITLLRFYVGNILHMKVNEDNPPRSSAFPWVVDFSVIMTQFSLFYLMGVSLNSVETFLRLLLFLCVLDVIWLSFNWLIGKIWGKFARGKTLKLWIYLNAVCAIFLSYLLFWFDGNLYTDQTLVGISGITLVFLIFLIAAVIDAFADYYLLLKGGYTLQRKEKT